MCVNYGGRAEIADAARPIAREVAAGRLDPAKVDERMLARYLDEPDMPDVDLFLRTVGGAAHQQLPALAVGVRRAGLPGHAVARLRPARPVAGLRGVRVPAPPLRRRADVPHDRRDRATEAGSVTVAERRMTVERQRRPVRRRRSTRAAAAAHRQAVPARFAGDLRGGPAAGHRCSAGRWSRCSATRCMQSWSTVFVAICVQATPFLVLGVVVSGAIAAFVPASGVQPGSARATPTLAVPVATRLRRRAARLRVRVGADLQPADRARRAAVGVAGVHAVRAGDQPDRADRHRGGVHQRAEHGVGQADRRPADRGDRRLDLGADRPAGVDETAGAGARPTVSRAGGCSCPPSSATSPRPPGSWCSARPPRRRSRRSSRRTSWRASARRCCCRSR